jgi:hypothetical protein
VIPDQWREIAEGIVTHEEYIELYTTTASQVLSRTSQYKSIKMQFNNKVYPQIEVVQLQINWVFFKFSFRKMGDAPIIAEGRLSDHGCIMKSIVQVILTMSMIFPLASQNGSVGPWIMYQGPWNLRHLINKYAAAMFPPGEMLARMPRQI